MKLVVTKKRSRYLSGNEEDLLKSEMQSLGKLFSHFNKDVYVVGGLSIGLTEGRFYRNPQDFDIALFQEDFPKFHEYMKSRGYGFVIKTGHTHISPKHDLNMYSEVDLNQIIDKKIRRVICVFCVKHHGQSRR